jgi:cobalt-zinc-cadmium efflux system outer membrane protein
MTRTFVIWAAALSMGLGAVVGAQPATPPQPQGPITLREAVALALEHSPSLRSFDWGRRAAEARTVQAGRRTNPTVSATLEDVGASSATVQPQATIQLGQLVELGGKRAARQQLASANTALAGWDYEAARLDVLTQVSSSFVGVLAAQDAVQQTATALKLAEQVRTVVGDRVTAGVVSPIESTRADVLVATAQIEHDQARHALDAGRRQLAALWGGADATFTQAVGALLEMPAVPSFASLDAALPKTPEEARWTSEVEQRVAALALALASKVPDVTLSAGYRRFTSEGRNAFMVGATIPIPWFDRNKDGIRAAEADVERARATAAAVSQDLRSRLAAAYRDVVSARDAVTVLRTTVIPAAQSVFDAVQEGYQLGRFGLLDVLDAQRTLSDAHRRHLDAVTRFHVAVTHVERLTDRPLQ